MKPKTVLFTGLLLISFLFCKAQNSVSIYEYGDSIVSCETNFENLFNNFNKDNITNASEYKLIGYSFVETIADSSRYRYYRNYFSGDKVFGAVYSTSSNTTTTYKQNKAIEVTQNEFFIRPVYVHPELYDTRSFPDSVKMILQEDTKQRAINILSQEINIDTIKLNYYTCEYHKIDTTIDITPTLNSYGISRSSSDLKVPYTDSIPQKDIRDYVMSTGRSTPDCSELNERIRLYLNTILVEKYQEQLLFNSHVSMGDKVYVVRFYYDGMLYSNYVICSAKTNKIVWDYFFDRIEVYPTDYELTVK